METLHNPVSGTATANCEAVASAGNDAALPQGLHLPADTLWHLQDEVMGVRTCVALTLLAVQSLDPLNPHTLEAALRDVVGRLYALQELLGELSREVRP